MMKSISIALQYLLTFSVNFLGHDSMNDDFFKQKLDLIHFYLSLFNNFHTIFEFQFEIQNCSDLCTNLVVRMREK